MRARKKKNTPARLEKCAGIILSEPTPDTIRQLSSGRKLLVEIGCGKGAFINALAEKNADCFCIGVEKVPDVMVMAAEKTMERDIKNIIYMNSDAVNLEHILPDGSVSVIYLNFSDPWPPKNRAKRRLTHRNFLEIYKKKLAPGGRIEFKTDNEALFDFSLSEFPECGFRLIYRTRDLHSADDHESRGNIMTEYEKRFSEQGVPIKKLVAVLGCGPED